MKICPNKNCGATGLPSNARYCPKCGTLLSNAKDVRLLEHDYWVSLKTKSQPSDGKTLIERDEFNRIATSYNDMINNGYASPLGNNELISDEELQRLRKNSLELERWKQECKKKENSIVYDYEDKYTHDFYWGNALLGLAILIAVAFWLFIGIPTIWGWFFNPATSKSRIEIVQDEKTGKYGIMNHQLDSMVTACIYDSIIHRENSDLYLGEWNFYQLAKDGKFAFADSSGINAVTALYDSITHINGSDVFMLYKDDKQGLMSGVGRLILNAEFYRVLWNYHGEDHQYNYYSFYSPKRFVGNIIPAKTSKDDKWELYNREGKKITHEKFHYVEQVCHPDLIKVTNSKYLNIWRLINKEGTTILPESYMNISMFHEDVAWVKKSFKSETSDPWFCISPTGERLGTLPTNYEPIDGFNSGLSPVKNRKASSGANIGYCNSKCQIVIPTKFGYSEIKENGTTYLQDLSFFGDSAHVSYQGKNGILRKDGTFIAEKP